MFPVRWSLFFLPVVCAWVTPPIYYTIKIQAARQSGLSFLAKSDGHHEGNAPAYNDGNVTELNGIDRIFCLSDLHTDHPDNKKWLKTKVIEYVAAVEKG